MSIRAAIGAAIDAYGNDLPHGDYLDVVAIALPRIPATCTASV
jgi:hypothetical protein